MLEVVRKHMSGVSGGVFKEYIQVSQFNVAQAMFAESEVFEKVLFFKDSTIRKNAKEGVLITETGIYVKEIGTRNSIPFANTLRVECGDDKMLRAYYKDGTNKTISSCINRELMANVANELIYVYNNYGYAERLSFETSMVLLGKFEEQDRSRLKNYFMLDAAYLCSDAINVSKLANAMNTFASGISKKDVIAQCDTTIFGSGKEGLIITESETIIHITNGKCRFSNDQFHSFRMENNEKDKVIFYIYLITGEIKVINVTASLYQGKLLTIMNFLQDYGNMIGNSQIQMDFGSTNGQNQQWQNPGMNQYQNPGMVPGMNQGMPQGTYGNQSQNPGMNQYQNPGMNQGMPQGTYGNQSQNPGVGSGMNPGVPQGGYGYHTQNPGMNQYQNPGMNQGMPQGTYGNQSQNPGMNQGMPQGTYGNQSQNPGMNQGMPQGTYGNQSQNPGMNQDMSQGAYGNQYQNSGANQGMPQGAYRNQYQNSGANQGMPQGTYGNQYQNASINQDMPQGIINNQYQKSNGNQGMVEHVNNQDCTTENPTVDIQPVYTIERPAAEVQPEYTMERPTAEVQPVYTMERPKAGDNNTPNSALEANQRFKVSDERFHAEGESDKEFVITSDGKYYFKCENGKIVGAREGAFGRFKRY